MKRIVLSVLILGMFIMLNSQAASADIADGLVAYYPFDGNAIDVSGNYNDGTEYGDLLYKSGVKGASASFDGIDDYIRVPSHSSLNPVDQLTISFWVKVDGYTNTWSPIIHKGGPVLSGSSNREYTVWLQDTSSFLLASAGDNSSQHYNYACCAKLDEWTHYVGIIDRQNHRMQVYVDGILVVDDNDPYSTFNYNNEDLLIGWTDETNSAFSSFKGRLDELRIYDRVLTLDEINILSEGATPTITGCNNTNFCNLEELLNGCSFKVGDLLMSNWELVNATNVNLNNIDIGPGYNSNEFGVLTENHELFVGTVSSPPVTKTLSFDFLVTGLGVNITQVKGDFGYRRISGYRWDSPWMTGRIAIGTSKGSNDLGQLTDVYSFNEDKHTDWINLLNGLNQIWIRNTITLNSSNHGYAEAGYYTDTYGPGFRISFNHDQSEPQLKPALIGGSLKIFASYDFYLEQNTLQEFPVQVSSDDEPQSVTLEIINPHPDLIVSLNSQNPIILAAGETQDIPISINTNSTPVGLYDDLLLKVTGENGETLYSNITISVTEQAAPDLPDLSISAADIQLDDYTLGETATLKAVIHNNGQASASNVQVQFYEFGNLLGEAVIDELPAEGSKRASITTSLLTEGEHLIQVVIDSSKEIEELDETNNEANKVVKIGDSVAIPGNILVTGSLPSVVYTDHRFTLSGRAVYDIYVDGIRYTNYVVKGGFVQVTIKDDEDHEWVYGGIHTDVNGRFSKTLQAPSTPGNYQIITTVTDETFIGKQKLVFSVTNPPPVLPSPPLPPVTTGQGYWIYTPTGSGTWTWSWTTPPVNEPTPKKDLRIFSENVHFTKTHPEPEEEITVFAEILYWATRTDLVAQNVPINFYVTYPGTPKMKIGETVIDSISVGAPDYGSRYVYTSWKNRNSGIYILEIEIDPAYVEENQLNNAATRAIIVGNLESYHGAIEGQVIDPWGGVGNIMVELYDESGTVLLASCFTNEAGHYCFENLPVSFCHVHIVTPAGNEADAETKQAEVVDQEISVVDFQLTKQTLICGDLDYDGDVDGDDRNILRGAFSTRLGDAGFIQEADYDDDGDIDYSDYQWWYGCYKIFITQ